MSYASVVCQHDKTAANTMMTQKQQAEADCHDMMKKHDMKTVIQKMADKKDCCGVLCDGISCGKMPLVTPAEVTDFKIPSLSGYEDFDLTSNGTRLEKLMRPPILR